MHQGRVYKTGDYGSITGRTGTLPEGQPSEWYVDGKGYRKRYTTKNGRRHYESEHRHIMETFLGRKLFNGENVHHKNGVTGDNRLENLELWVTKQPVGQRPEDLVMWAREILTRYDPEYPIHREVL